MKSNLSCSICLKHLHCKIINEIDKIREGNIQLSLLETKDILKDKLKELEDKMIKCLRKRIYLHYRFPKYILFKDNKYVHSDDEQYLYSYCNREREYLLNCHYDKIREELEKELGE